MWVQSANVPLEVKHLTTSLDIPLNLSRELGREAFAIGNKKHQATRRIARAWRNELPKRSK
jgi:hypothetical protein